MQIKRLFTADEQPLSDDLCAANWSIEATELFKSDALCSNMPVNLKPVEENTLPSWLWRHTGEGLHVTSEHEIHLVLHRITGSATYAGWKKDLFSDENEARAFYDEVFFLLSNRIIAIEPAALASLGTDWAYGLVPVPMVTTSTKARTNLEITNQSIDAILSGSDNGAQSQWHKFLGCDAEHLLSIRFSDTANEWGIVQSSRMPRLMINLAKLCCDDGSFDIDALHQATQLSVILLELHYEQLASTPESSRSLSIGYCNLATALMQQGIAYDSDAGRSTAAAVSSIITATATLTSAQLAQFFGPCQAFSQARTTHLRTIANRHRAAHGDKTDYEHVSVLPVPLCIDTCPQLPLLAAARRLWDEALVAAQRYGVRHIQLTSLFNDPELNIFMEVSSVGVEPERSLLRQVQTEQDIYRREIHPVVPHTLARLGYDPADIKAIVDHVVGYGTLEAAPAINHSTLMEHGLDAEAVMRIEEYLPRANDIRFACTPWVIGEVFCHDDLKIPEAKIKDFNFDLLSYLGFSTSEVIAANNFCYGHGNVETVTELKHEHRPVFVCSDDIDASAQIRMAAAVQSFITGDIDLIISLPSTASTFARSDLLLGAWKQGLKNIALYIEHPGLDKTPVIPALTKSVMRSKIVRSRAQHEIAVKTPASHRPKQKAPSRMASIGKSGIPGHKGSVKSK